MTTISHSYYSSTVVLYSITLICSGEVRSAQLTFSYVCRLEIEQHEIICMGASKVIIGNGR